MADHKYPSADQNIHVAASQMGSDWQWEQLPVCSGRETFALWKVKAFKTNKQTKNSAWICHTGSVSLLRHITSRLMSEHTRWKDSAGQMDIKHNWILPTSRNICDLQVGNLRWALVWCPPWHRGGCSLWGALPNSLLFSTVCSAMKNISPGYHPEQSSSSLQFTRTTSDCSDCF